MPDKGKKRPISDEQWTEIRAAHAKGESDLSIAKRLGIHRNSIRNRRAADGKRGDPWIVQPDVRVANPEAVQRQAQAKVIDLATRRALEQAEQSGVVADIADAVAAELLATQTAAKLAGEYMVSILKDAKAGKIAPASSPGEQTKADVAKAVMSAYRTFQTTVRENHGLRPGTPSIPKDTDGDGKPAIIELEIVDGPQAEAS